MAFGDTRRHQEDKTPHWRRREHATTGADQTPSNAIFAIRTVPDWHVGVVPGATEVAVRAVLVRSGSLGAAVQRRPSKYSEVTGALVAGRAVT